VIPNPQVALFEKIFRPTLENIASELSRSFPRWDVGVHSAGMGSLTGFHAHSLGIACLAPDMPLDRVDHVALCLEIAHITTDPHWHSADVCWGHPSPYVEADILPEQISFNRASAQVILDRLPVLTSALREALRREFPAYADSPGLRRKVCLRPGSPDTLARLSGVGRS